MISITDLLRWLREHGCRHRERHLAAIIESGRPLSCHEAGVRLYFRRL